MLAMPASSYAMAGGLMGVGAVAGVGLGSQVDPIALPQTVAAFHSLVGLAAMVTSIASFQAHPTVGCNLHNVAAILGDFIGGVTLTGSLVAFGKLNGNLSSAAMNLPGKNFINMGCAGAQLGLAYSFLNGGGLMELWATVALS